MQWNFEANILSEWKKHRLGELWAYWQNKTYDFQNVSSFKAWGDTSDERMNQALLVLSRKGERPICGIMDVERPEFQKDVSYCPE